MKEADIIDALRASRRQCTPTELAVLLGRLTNGGLSQASLVTYFKRAFPEVPLRILLDAGGWHRLSAGGLSDEDFDRLLAPHLLTEE
jgi:hypothetical protein